MEAGMTLTSIETRALKYIDNTVGNATVDDFEEDHDPIGRNLLLKLMPRFSKAIYDEARGRQYLHLTDEGRSALEADGAAV
jgi:hypothetical protein